MSEPQALRAAIRWPKASGLSSGPVTTTFAVVLLAICAVDEVGVMDLGHAGRQVAGEGAVLRRRQLDRGADRFDLDWSIDHVDDAQPLEDVGRRIVPLLRRHAHFVAGEGLA